MANTSCDNSNDDQPTIIGSLFNLADSFLDGCKDYLDKGFGINGHGDSSDNSGNTNS